MSLYKEEILDHYHKPFNAKLLEKYDTQSTASNPVCGDEITLNLQIENDIVTNVGYSAKGCVISLASASMISEDIKGKSVSDLRKLDHSYILDLLGIELTPNRLKCALLALEAVHNAL